MLSIRSSENGPLRRILNRFNILLAAACIGFSAAASAQVLNGTISGTVVDQSDAVVPGATVTITDISTHQAQKTATNEVGAFTVPNLANGFYKVTVEHTGFATAVADQVQVFVSRITPLRIKMEVAKTGTEVVVEAQATTVQTESVELKNSIDRQQIMNLPLSTRNPLDLVKSFAGIVSPTSSTIGDAFVHGLRGNATNLTQDGINVADYTVKTSGFFAISAPTVDTVGEFNVSVGGIGVDAGFGAAQVSIVTQRGGNDYHGSAFWFQRTNELNANTFFNNLAGVPRPFQLQNRLGGSGGGPVWIPGVYKGKNRTWIFGSYEAYREPLSRGRTRTVLTPSARNGSFTWTPPGSSAAQTINLLNIGTIGSTGLKPAINPDVMNFYNKYVPSTGLTNAGCGNGDGVNIQCFVFNLPGKNITDRYTIRVDHQLTQNHSLEFVWNQADFDATPDLLNGNEPQFPTSPGGSQGSRRQVFVWALQSVFGSNKTNEFRVGYQRAPVGFNYPYQFGDTGGYQLVTGGGLTRPVLTSTNLPQGRNTPVRQAIDNFGWVKGNHNLRFGGEWRLILANNYFYNTVIPSATLGNNSANPDGLVASLFPGGISSADLARAQTVFDTVTGLLGSVSQGYNHTSANSGYVAGSPRIIQPIQPNLSFYGQDSWKLRRNLTLQYGVRWEYQGVFDERTGLVLLPSNGLAGVFGPTPANVGALFTPGNTTGATDVALTLQGTNNGKPFYHRDLNNFGPFLGFAWDPFGDGKTSIRASMATHFTQDGFTFFDNAATANAGLFTTANNTVPTGVFTAKAGANQNPTPPPDKFPVSQLANFAASSNQSLTAFDPNLATPYIFEWSLGVQREIGRRWTVEARYVGNHAVKQYRAWSVNEIDLNHNGLLNEFEHAQSNLSISQAAGKGSNFSNQGLPGQVPLPIFEKIFTKVSNASGFANSSFVTNLQQNNIGTMFDTIRRSPTYRNNITASFPLNFFVANPWANQALVYNNAGWSYYDGLEFEVNRRMSNGLVLQGTYTLSKVLTDSTFLTSQNEGANYQSLENTSLDKFRAAFDTRQSIAYNFLYPLPFGHNRRFGASVPNYVNLFIGGWDVNGFGRWTTGAPFTITSGRNSTGSLINSPAVLRNMTASQLQNSIGTFRTGNGVYWLDPKSGLLSINGSRSTPVLCTPGQTTPCFDFAAAGTIGNTGYNTFSGPRFFGQDASLVKHNRFNAIDKTFDVELRFEMFNVFNNSNFTGLQLNTNTGSAFGQLTGTLDTTRSGGVLSRTGQWAVRVSF